ncbi:MAG: hypothetical protein GY788_00890 [bacterium]|nr:hypothetical protein [bacterium]
MLKRLSIALALALLLAACGGSDEGDAASAASETTAAAPDEEMTDEHVPSTFTVTVANTSDAAQLATPLAPGAFIVHTSMETLFADGTVDRGEGLEALAEDGDPSGLVTSLAALSTVSTSGAFTNPDGGDEAGPALPGSSYSFTFEATPGDYLSFATMFVQSNDWFFAPASSGINLFDGDMPVAGDVTDLVGLWDAGTEVDETTGEGANQAPRQAGPNTGDDQGAPITAVSDYDGTISVTITVG